MMPAPVRSSRAPVGDSALPSIRATTSGPVSPGNRARTSAATPDATAVAKLVPLDRDEPVPPADSDTRSTPGAPTSTHGPRLESSAGCPAGSTLATASTPS